MKIKKTKEIMDFIQRCEDNLMNEGINDYISVIFDKSEEDDIKEELHVIEALEYMSNDRSKWPSLYISTDKYQETPYNRNIKLDGVNSNGFKYELFEMPANELINVDVIKDDPKRELNDSIVLRAFDKPFKTAILKQDDEMWMSDTPQEANTINPYALKAHGKVLTFGLGIGYFVYMALLNTDVESITIIEHSSDLIEMFKKHLLPQFPHQDKITIIHSDAYEYYNQENIDKYDYVFVDIHKSSDDGYQVIERMLETYNPPFEKINFWIEETCVEFIRGMMLIYFKFEILNKPIEDVDDDYMRIYDKIDTYFSGINKTVESVDELKDYLYDKKVIRDIIAVNFKN